MGKTVFTPLEFKDDKQEKVTLKLLRDYSPVEEEVVPEVEEQYTGPTVEELQREADEFKKNWEVEKQKMMDDAKAEAERIVNAAHDDALAKSEAQSAELQTMRTQAESEAQQKISDAQSEADRILQEAKENVEKLRSEASAEGFEKGREDGYNKGYEEVERLIERVHKMMDAMMMRRQSILESTERQIVDLVLLISRKVVKTISENQKTVILDNIMAALEKVKGRGKVTIRVNLADLKLATEHTKNFIQRFEQIEGMDIIEDSTIDPGGCVVETDFGAIDARIASQLSELEDRILEISPIRTRREFGRRKVDLT